MNQDSHPTSRQAIKELLRQHDRPGPRYTSYPTAVEFHEDVGRADYEVRLTRLNEEPDAPLSVYIHLPFCAHRCLFCGCHVIITPHKERALPYLDLLHQEIDLVAESLPRRRIISQLHLGGGTPTYHEPEQLRQLLERIGSHFTFAENAELAVEVDPRVTTEDHVRTLGQLGFNRISLGVQDFTPEVQEAIARVQSEEQTAAIIECARANGYRGINLDLIYGLPLQKLESFERSVEAAIRLGADRTAVYSFAYVPWIRGHQKRIDQEKLPSPDLKMDLFAMARERFLNAGYEPIGMDHFARPDDELAVARRAGRLRRNFQGYTVIPAEDAIGLGISAIGDLRDGYFQNEKKLSTYQQDLDAGHLPVERGVLLSKDDQLRRSVIHDLMCNFRIDIPGHEKRYGIEFAKYFAEDLKRLAEHEREGLVTLGDDLVEATPMGGLFVRNLAMCFDRYFWEKHSESGDPVFSRTV